VPDETEWSSGIYGSRVVGLIKKERPIQWKVIGLLIEAVKLTVQLVDSKQVPDKVPNITLGLEIL